MRCKAALQYKPSLSSHIYFAIPHRHTDCNAIFRMQHTPKYSVITFVLTLRENVPCTNHKLIGIRHIVHLLLLSSFSETGVQTVNVSPEVQDMCAQVGKILAKYRSGPLPKMFKVIPKMRSWEELVYLTG